MVLNLMSFGHSSSIWCHIWGQQNCQNGSKANSLHLSPHKLCPFRNNEILQELRKRPYYPFKVDYVYHWMNLFVVQVQKCGRPPIIESNILTKNTCFGDKNHKESHYPKDKMSSNYAFFVVASSPWWPQLWLKMIDWHESVPISVFPCRVIYRWVVGNPLSFDVYKNWFQGDIHFSK